MRASAGEGRQADGLQCSIHHDATENWTLPGFGAVRGIPPPPPRQQATDEGGDVGDSKRNVITTTIMSYGLSPETLALLTSFRWKAHRV